MDTQSYLPILFACTGPRLYGSIFCINVCTGASEKRTTDVQLTRYTCGGCIAQAAPCSQDSSRSDLLSGPLHPRR